MKQPEPPPLPPEDKLDATDIIVEAMREKFGASAILVARNQLRVASTASVEAWAKVVARLDQA